MIIIFLTYCYSLWHSDLCRRTCFYKLVYPTGSFRRPPSTHSNHLYPSRRKIGYWNYRTNHLLVTSLDRCPCSLYDVGSEAILAFLYTLISLYDPYFRKSSRSYAAGQVGRPGCCKSLHTSIQQIDYSNFEFVPDHRSKVARDTLQILENCTFWIESSKYPFEDTWFSGPLLLVDILRYIDCHQILIRNRCTFL